jgi:hypothetical protein
MRYNHDRRWRKAPVDFLTRAWEKEYEYANSVGQSMKKRQQ